MEVIFLLKIAFDHRRKKFFANLTNSLVSPNPRVLHCDLTVLCRGDWALGMKPVLHFSVPMLVAGFGSDNWVDRTLLKPVEAVTSTRERSTDYYDNGQRKYERSGKGRKLDGPVTWWYENGKKKKLNFKDDEQHGLPIWWNENGEEMYRKPTNTGKKL